MKLTFLPLWEASHNRNYDKLGIMRSSDARRGLLFLGGSV
jgi:hypothetical protein